MDRLIPLVEQWARDRNILSYSVPQVLAQLGKVKEELHEVETAFRILAEFQDHYDTINAEETIDRLETELTLELGDLMVTVIISAACMQIPLDQALEAAYNKIKHRKGKVIDGVFVKEEDLH